MSGYCPDCGNTMCLCTSEFEEINDNERGVLMSFVDSLAYDKLKQENEKLKAEIENLDRINGMKGSYIDTLKRQCLEHQQELKQLRELVKQAKPFVSGEHHHSLKQEVRKEWNEKAKEILE